jgi:hypothetical protein
LRTRRADLLGEERVLIDGVAAFTAGILTISELVTLTWVMWLLLFGLASGLLFARWRSRLRLLFGLWLIWLVACSVLLFGRMYVEAQRPAAVIVEERVTVMSGPDEVYLELYTLHAAAELRLLETREGWVRFTLPDGRQGWLPQDTVAIV